MGKILLIVSGIIIALTTSGFIAVTHYFDAKIEAVQTNIALLDDKDNIFLTNGNLLSQQLVKMAVSDGTKVVLEEIGSTKSEDFSQHLRNQAYQSIAILRGEKLNSTEIKELDKLNLSQLNTFLDSEWKKNIDQWSQIRKSKKDYVRELDILDKQRRNLILYIAIVQAIGLFLGVWADYLKD